MNTAVQLRPIGPLERPRCDLAYGVPHEVVAGELGRIALFSPGQVVAYRLKYQRHSRLFVFRTLDVADRLAARVPGVRPSVQLLLELRSTRRVRLVSQLFAYLTSTECQPLDLTDAFYARVSAVLGGHLPSHNILLSLLQDALRGPFCNTFSERGSAR